MSDRFGYRLAIGIVMLAAVAAVGFYTYNLGLAHGIAESGRAIAVPGGGVPVVAIWPRPWGFGFGFFPFFPLFFILFWVFVLRGMFWRRRWHGRGYGYDGVPPAFDEWHGRAHADSEKRSQAMEQPAPGS